MSSPAGNTAPTRMELNNIKNKLVGAQRGYDLLKKKSDALTLRFRSLLREIREVKLEVGNLAKDALFAYTEVKFVARDISPTVIQSVGNIPLLIMMNIDNIAGVKVPDFERAGNSNAQFGDSLVGISCGGQQIQKAREAFTKLLDALVKLASLQTTFAIVDEVLKVTNRRVNAMEYVLIPRYQEIRAFIEGALDENEREEFYRLKKVQAKRKEIEAKEEAERLARFTKAPEEDDKAKNILEDDSTDTSDLLF